MADLPVETTAEEVVAAPRRLKHSRLDLILALAAIAMSAISLVVAIQNSRIQRELLAGSTWPFVQRDMSSAAKGGFVTIGIANDGVGPAKIRSVELFVDGRPMRDTRALLRACCDYQPAADDGRLMSGIVSSLADNTVLRAGESNAILRIPAADSPGLHERLRRALPRISFRSCYCSVLDRCWTADLASTLTTPVDACPAPVNPFDPIRR